MILSKLLPVVVGLGAGILVSAGVFTVLLSVGLVPRFAGKTHTGEKIFLYEEMVVFGTLVGCLASVFPGAVIFGREWLQKRLEAGAAFEWLVLTAEAANVAHLQSLFDLPCDALVHPFSPKQLMNAVENLLLLAQSLLRAGPLRLDTLHHRVTMAGERLTLTAQEFALLEVLVKTPGAAVSRETLLRTAWGYQDLGETRTVDVHIQRLRRKLGKSCIETVYKTGYKLKMA